MFSLGIRYLTGYAVATDISNRERAEWPPHPARVFMALAAAHFETGEDPAERAALEWLEGLEAPAMSVPAGAHREVVTHYVPVNDTNQTELAVLPQYRTKQPRTFPRVAPAGEMVYLIWPTADVDGQKRAAMERLAGKAIRIGHSSSLVQMWVEDNPPAANWVPEERGELRMRVTAQGTLGYLKAQFNEEAVEAHADLVERIKSAKGKAKKELQRELAERFGDRAPTSRRPNIGLWQSYRHKEAQEDQIDRICRSGVFDSRLMILTIEEGPTLGLESTWTLLTAVRDTILSLCDPVPEWVSGHKSDGTPSEEAHLALLPLAFTGHMHSDGHLLGVGVAFPKGVPPRERGRALRRLLYDDEGEAKEVNLTLGALGAWTLSREMRPSAPRTLRSETWTGPARTWATVTPIILDRHPKADYGKERARWREEVTASIVKSCLRQGLPEPAIIDVDKTSWQRGAPRAVAGKGGGFPTPPLKGRETARQQVHAWLRFDREITGPLLLGAGRYRGYGVLKPWMGDEQ